MLGNTANPLILFKLHAEPAAEARGRRSPAPLESTPRVEEWFQSLVRVRSPMDTLGRVVAYGDWLGAPAELTALQFPVRPGDAGSAASTATLWPG